MASLGLGFRPPQFSEDVAWLPAWLQPRQSNSSNGNVHESQNQEYKNFPSVRGSKEVDLLSREGGKQSSFHLFLSGEDNSPMSLASSPANVLRLHLQLSSDDDTQNNKSQTLCGSQSKKNTDKFLSVQLVKTSTDGGEKGHQPRPSSYIHKGNISCDKKRAENTVPQLVDNKERICEETNIVKHVKDTDFDNAIELSVAASEALVIHELVSMSETLPAAAVLEAALRVKQARLESREDAFCYPIGEPEEIDFLSDLDDDTMADSFEDVGLSLSGSGGDDMDISQVQDTPLSDDVYMCEDEFIHMKLPSQQKKLSEGANLGLHAAHSEIHAGPIMLNKPSIDVSDVGQKVATVPQLDGNTSQAQNSQSAGEGEASYLVANKFESRWLGGWTGKVVDASAKLLNDNPKRVPNFFVGETSFLSESADVAPDENSVVQKLETRCTLASQSSVPFAGFCGKDNEGGLVSQDIVIASNKKLETRCTLASQLSVPFEGFCGKDNEEGVLVSQDIVVASNQKLETRCTLASQSSVPFERFCGKDDEGVLVCQDIVIASNQSLIDPLCSVVPCSVSLENANSPASQIQNEPLGNASFLDPSFELQGEITLRTSDLNVEYAHDDGKIESGTVGECSLAPIRRNFTSLRTYSVLSPKPDTILDRRNSVNNISLPTECSKDLLSPEQNLCCISSYHKRDSKEFLPSTSTEETTNGKDREQNQIRNMVEETAGESIHAHKPVENGDALQVKLSRKGRPPLIVNRKMWHRLRASKLRICNSSEKKNPNYTAVTAAPETTFELRQSESNKLDLAQVHGRKRTRFSEVETVLQHRSGAQQLPSSHTNCSTFQACKRLKYSHALPDIRTETMKKCFVNRLKDANKLLFLGIEFLLTGFSSKKAKDIELQIRKNGGMVLMDIPPPPNSRVKKSSGSHLQQLPVILCSKKLQTTKFLYGCAVNAFLLKAKWLTDSIEAGSIVQPAKYMILPWQSDVNLIKIGKSVHTDNNCIFQKLGIMLHGKPSFCTKFTIIVKHGRGNVFKRLQGLTQCVETKRIEVVAIVAEDDSRVSRHLRHCALERKIPVMPASWIVKSLHLGKLLPQIENKHIPLPTIKFPESPNSLDWSQEI